jgi:hypothetical protein
MSKFSAVIAVVLMLCASVQLYGQAAPRYTDAENGFSFAPPAGWTRKEGLPKPLVAYTGKPDQNYSPKISVNVFSRPVKKTEEAAFLESVKTEYKKHGRLSAIRRTKIAGKPAYTWSAKISLPNYPTVVNRQIVCFQNERAYELTFTTLPTNSKKYEPVFAQICASFRFHPLKPTAPGK